MIKELKISDLNFIINRTDKNKLEFTNDLAKARYNFISEYPNQTIYYVVNDDKVISAKTGADITDKINVSESILQSLEKIGVYLKSKLLAKGALVGNDIDTDFLANSTRNYVLIIGETKDNSIQSYLNKATEFVETYIPSGEIPSYYFDENIPSTTDEIIEKDKKINNLFPDIQIQNTFGKIMSSYAVKEIFYKKLKETYGNVKSENLLDITDNVNRILEIYKRNNVRTHKKFFEEMEIVSSQLTKDTIVICTGLSSSADLSVYASIAAYLTYFHNAICFVIDTYYDVFISTLGKLYYDHNLMLVEERVKYLLNFPNLTFRALTSSYSPTYLVTYDVFVKGNCHFCNLNINAESIINNVILEEEILPSIRKDTIQTNNDLDFKKIHIINISSLFTLDSDNISVNTNNSNMLNKIIRKLEFALEDDNIPVLSIFDIFFFEYNGKLAIGYLREMKFSTNSTLIVDSMIEKKKNSKGKTYYDTKNATLTDYSINEDAVAAYLPIDILQDKNIVLAKIYFSAPKFAPAHIQKHLLGANSEIKVIPQTTGIKLSSKYVTPFQLFWCGSNANNILSGIDINERHYAGMYSYIASMFRSNPFKELFNKVDRQYLKEKVLSIYGDVAIGSGDKIIIQSNKLKR